VHPPPLLLLLLLPPATYGLCAMASCSCVFSQREGMVLDLVEDIRQINMKAMKARHTGKQGGACDGLAMWQGQGVCQPSGLSAAVHHAVLSVDAHLTAGSNAWRCGPGQAPSSSVAASSSTTS